MPWIELDKKRRKKNVPPTVAIDKMGLYLNRAAADYIGRDKRAVRLFFDPDTNPPLIGLWFFKEKDKTDKPERAYSVVHYDETGVAKISCSKFIETHGLLMIKRKAGKASFMLSLDKDEMTGGEFYKVSLE